MIELTAMSQTLVNDAAELLSAAWNAPDPTGCRATFIDISVAERRSPSCRGDQLNDTPAGG